MTDNVKCLLNIRNLPEDFFPTHRYMVIRSSGGNLYYYGTYKEKHRADYALMEIGSGFVVELVKRGGFNDGTDRDDNETRGETPGMDPDGTPLMGSP